jgi:hypothetical protein
MPSNAFNKRKVKICNINVLEVYQGYNADSSILHTKHTPPSLRPVRYFYLRK